MKGKTNKKWVESVIIAAICALFLGGMLFYRECSNETVSPKEVEKEIAKEVEKPKIKPRPPKENIPVAVNPPQPKEESVVPDENRAAPDSIKAENIPETAVPEKEIETTELTAIYIPMTKSLFSRSDLSAGDLPKGKIYYSGANGRLESFVTESNGKITEQLVSYNPQGEKVDYLEIGLIDENAGRKKYAVFSQNRISTYHIISGKSDKNEERVTNYTVTPELRFVKGKTYTKII